MAPHIVVTAHARRRWSQRAAPRLGIRDVEAVARSAWQHGRPARHSRKNARGERRVYMGWVFVFDTAPDAVALLTVIPPKHG